MIYSKFVFISRSARQERLILIQPFSNYTTALQPQSYSSVLFWSLQIVLLENP